MSYLGPVLTLKHWVALGRQFHRRFGHCAGHPAAADERAYRATVAAQLAAIFAVPLPKSLDWLVIGACRRSVPAAEVVAFIAEAFRLEPVDP